MKIGSMVNTAQGIGFVSGIAPGSRQVGGETVRQAVVETSSAPRFPQDEVRLSTEARQSLQQEQQASARIGGIVNTPQGPSTVVRVLPGGNEALTQALTDTAPNTTDPATNTPTSNGRLTPVYTPTSESELSPEARASLRELQSIDRAVRTEEQTHAAVAGAYGSTPQYTYVRGPDGRQYAVGGSVSVDTSSAVTPEQAQQAAGAVAAAAASVNTPSSADFQAVAQANRTNSDNQNTAGSQNESQPAAAATNDPMQQIREQARSAYRSWQNAPAGARLDIAA